MLTKVCDPSVAVKHLVQTLMQYAEPATVQCSSEVTRANKPEVS
jgi:hypothetical protein